MPILERCKEWWRIYNMMKTFKGRLKDMPPEVRDLYEIDIALSGIRPADRSLWPESERGKELPKD